MDPDRDGYESLPPFEPIAAIVSCLWLMMGLPGTTWARFRIWLLIGIVIYFLFEYRRRIFCAAKARGLNEASKGGDVGTAAAVPCLHGRFGRQPGSFRIPGGLAVPVFALLLCITFLLSASTDNLTTGAIALGVGAVLYALRRKPPPGAATVPPEPLVD